MKNGFILNSLSKDNAMNVLYPLFLGTSECIMDDLNIFWQWLSPSILEHDIRFRKCFSVAERLALTLQFFATEDAHQVFHILIFIYRFV